MSATRRSFLLSSAAFAATRPAFDTKRLEAARESIARHNTKALLVLHEGKVAAEWYGEGMSADTKHYTASMAKALVGGTSLLVAMNDGLIRAEDRASKFIPSWKDDPRKSKITIRHLATHTSGIEDSTIVGIAHNQEPGWKGRFWRREPDPFAPALHEAPVLFEPGTGNQYSNPGMAALAWCVTASLRGAPQADILSLLRERVMRPLGIADKDWSIGYGRAYKIDGMDVYANWGGGAFTPRATARVAEWMIHKGAGNGKALVRPATVERALHYAGMPLPNRTKEPRAPGSGLGWYTNFDGVWPSVPRDAFAGAGAGHQLFLAVPSLDLIVVRNGGDLVPRESEATFWTAAYEHVFDPIMQALGNPVAPQTAPYPRSTAIQGVDFAPESTIVRQAIDSDNWPCTWGDDDAIYTSYGDGFGFEPRVQGKLSMGFAKVEGSPANFKATNIRSTTGETVGDGPKGPKASGIVMVDGVLYMWVRNTGNSQLWWSPDHALTWEKGFTFDHGMGSPAFLNFGRNYAGANDDFVYAYSQQGPSAYGIDDGVVLARAAKSQLRDRRAWRFWTAIEKGAPSWSSQVEAARPVFRFPSHIQRVDAVYHAATKRYLLIAGYGHNGGWGIFDAPMPWGPWTTTFHTEYWGLGETHGYRLPSKWISPDGHSLALVFSGLIYNGLSYDAFCVREMKFRF